MSPDFVPTTYVVGELRKCPRCGGLYRWWKEYVDHAWTEKP